MEQFLNKRCRVFYFSDNTNKTTSCRIGTISGYDSVFLNLEDSCAIPINRIVRVEVIQ